MKFLAVSLLLVALAAAKPLPEPSLTDGFTRTSLSASMTESDNAVYTADIDTTDKSAPPPLWDPPTPPPPPLFEAPKEDLPLVPSWLLSVHEAPVQSVRVEKLAPFTAAKVQPVDNIYAPSPSDEEGNFNGEGSLRPGHRSFGACIVSFVSSWFWWISVVVLAAIVVYVAEKMLIGSVKAARKARSASRVARSRAASLMQGTRSRAASILGDNGRGRSATLLEKPVWRIERSPSPPIRNRSWDDSMV